MSTQLAKAPSKRKLLIVGQPSSGYDQIGALLHSCGMKTARPSRREGFLPTEISLHLSRAHGIQPIGSLSKPPVIEQIEPGPVWHGMVLDLMLGNLEQDLWGWADAQSVFLLDYWRALDPAIFFVLVFDVPGSVLSDPGHGPEDHSSNAWRDRMDGWCAFNAALLRFFYRHPERCVLVHAQEFRRSKAAGLKQVGMHLGAPLRETQDSNPSGMSSPTKKDAGDDLLKRHLARQLAEEHLEARLLYEELQSVATFPLADGADEVSPNAAWSVFLTLNRQQADQARCLVQDLETARDALRKRQLELNELRLSMSNLEHKGRKESELLLHELHQVQEELERYYLGAASLRQAPKDPSNKAASRKVLRGAADRVKQQLSYRIGATMISHSRSFTGWASMPWGLFRTVRRFRMEAPKRKAARLPPIASYSDAHEAEKARLHLSYRLGAAAIAHSRSPAGWISLPLAIVREVKDFRRRRRLASI